MNELNSSYQFQKLDAIQCSIFLLNKIAKASGTYDPSTHDRYVSARQMIPIMIPTV